MTEIDHDLWTHRAELLLEQALGELLGNHDPIPTITAALMALRIECGEEPADQMDGYPFPEEERDESGCTCPPDLVARGGWRSSCPVHGNGLSIDKG